MTAQGHLVPGISVLEWCVWSFPPPPRNYFQSALGLEVSRLILYTQILSVLLMWFPKALNKYRFIAIHYVTLLQSYCNHWSVKRHTFLQCCFSPNWFVMDFAKESHTRLPVLLTHETHGLVHIMKIGSLWYIQSHLCSCAFSQLC